MEKLLRTVGEVDHVRIHLNPYGRCSFELLL